MLKHIVQALRKTEGAHDWLVRHVRTSSTQHYVIGSRLENRRQVSSEKAVVTVMNDHRPAAGNGDRMRGEADVTILPTDLPYLAQKLADAVFMASLTNNPAYGPPGPAEYAEVELADPEMHRDPARVAERLVDELAGALADEQSVRLSSAEVFVEESQVAIENSRGVQGQETHTDLLLDYVLLAASRTDEMEAHIAFERRRAADLDVPAMARRQAQYARDALRAVTPQTGSFPVVVSDDALVELLTGSGYSPLIFRSSAQHKYQKLSQWEPGQSIFEQAPSGDAFSMYSNALLPFGTQSHRFDADGVPGQRVAIVREGVLRQFWAASRYAQYMDVPATGRFANMEISAGSLSFDDLLRDTGRLYHIVAFSAMSPDPITGDFVGEIRLGYELEGGRSRPIRGGSISGNVLVALARAHFSQETAMLGHYLGPRAMRFPKVTVAGN
jgi:PmbA protein